MPNKWLDMITTSSPRVDLPLVVLGSASGHAIHKADDRDLIGVQRIYRETAVIDNKWGQLCNAR
jgi:hypothetical protein